ncbi:MAG: MBOAT family protein [Ruminococcaceae bacterium]|nr:MBOAT family protein [Oscillospiraceae bacterium]
MTFSSIEFIVFFVIVYALILIFNLKIISEKVSEKKQLLIKHSILLLASYVFYGWWDWRFCFLMLLLTFVAFICARQIDKNKHRKLFQAIGVIVPLIVLCVFKYFNFFIMSFTDLFGIDNPGTLAIILPVGISFYTFQSMSYTMDVSRGHIKSHCIMNVALYVAFFPQLVAGPIVKASDFMPQLESNHKLKMADFREGIQIFTIGLFKKLVIADNLSVFVDDVFSKPLAFSSLSVILAVISYSIQIYCDFSGYSDMAIGVAKCFGYDFERNFNVPYLSKNVSEFWKRWHISLSSWLQQYLYISLGGNRKGKIRTYINLLLTMVLGGLWHGASYNFIIWGLLHGLALCAHKFYAKVNKPWKPNVVTKMLSVLGTYCFVCVCWVFFRAETLTLAMNVLGKMFIWTPGIVQVFSWTIFAVAVIIVSHGVVCFRKRKLDLDRVEGYYPVVNLNTVWGLTLFFVFWGIILCLAYTNANPFIYFQF